MMRTLLIAVCLLPCLFGCGYHFGGETDQLPGGVRNLYVAMFDNQTKEAFLENLVTNRVIEKFARTGKIFIVEDKSVADGVLSGVITGYSRNAVAYSDDDSIIEYRSYIDCSAELRRVSDNVVLWKGAVSWNEEFSSDTDREAQEDNEAQAQEAISKRLADELYARLTENF